MTIKGISEVRRLPRLGKVRLGVKETSQKTGNPYPRAVDYFVVNADQSTTESAANAFHQVYGDKPRVLDIMFPTENRDQFFPQFYRRYGSGSGLLCKGNGETADEINRETGEIREIECNPAECKWAAKKHCRPVGALQFLLPKVPGLGVWQIDTSSYHSIVNLNSAIDFVRALTGGRIAMIPLKLVIRSRDVQVEGRRKTIYVMDLAHEEVRLQDILMDSKKSITQLLLPGVNFNEVPDDLFPPAVLNAEEMPCEEPKPEPETKPETKTEANPEPPKTDPKPQVEVYEGVVTIAAAPEKQGEKHVYYTVAVTSEDGKVDGLVGNEKLASFVEGEKYKIKGQFKVSKVKVAQFEKIETAETLTPPAEWVNDDKEAGTDAGITITFAGEEEGEPYTGMVAVTDPIEGGFKGFDVTTDNLLTLVGNIEGLKPGEGVEVTGRIKDGVVTVESYKSFGSPAEEPPKAEEEPTYTLKVASLPAEGAAEENGKIVKVHWFWAFVGENKGVVAVDQESGLKLPNIEKDDILVVTGSIQKFRDSNVLFITDIKTHEKSAL